MSAPVAARVDGAVGILELARPDKFNCLSIAAWRFIGESLASGNLWEHWRLYGIVSSVVLIV